MLRTISSGFLAAAFSFGPATAAGVSLWGSSSAGEKPAAKDSRPPSCRPIRSTTRMDFSGCEGCCITVEDLLCGPRLGLEHRPVGNVAVPFDERRDRAGAADDDFEQFPQRIGHRSVMTVDEQAIAFVVDLIGMSGQV